MKIAFVECTFMELPVPKATQTGRGEGSSNSIAIARAMRAALKKVSKRHISAIKATITLTTKAEDKPTEGESNDANLE